MRRLYERDHNAQVLGTFGLILFFNEAARMLWGNSPLFLSIPDVKKPDQRLASPPVCNAAGTVSSIQAGTEGFRFAPRSVLFARLTGAARSGNDRESMPPKPSASTGLW